MGSSTPCIIGSKGRQFVWCLIAAIAISLSPQSPAAAQSFSSDRVHVVASGETLSELAERYGTNTDVLVRVNQLASSNFIRVGQRLTITAGNPPPAVPPLANDESHVVQAGESLLLIASMHRVSADTITRLNSLVNPNRILAGQILKIPRGESTGTPAEPAASLPRQSPAGTESPLQVAYRSQFTGSPYEESDCGPATLGMVLSYYGQNVSTNALRKWIMESTRYWGYDYGSDWESLVHASTKAGLRAEGLYNPSGGYRTWTFDDLTARLKDGDPVMLLVRFRALPGHTGSSWWGDHYIAVLGAKSDGSFIYHDSAFRGQSEGAYRTISRDALQKAWSSTSVRIAYSGMVLRK